MRLMSDKVEIKSFSKEKVAYDLMILISNSGFHKPSQEENKKDAILDLYAECLHATSNNRNFKK